VINDGAMATVSPSVTPACGVGAQFLVGPITNYYGKPVDLSGWAQIIAYVDLPFDPNISPATGQPSISMSTSTFNATSSGFIECVLTPSDLSQLVPGQQNNLIIEGKKTSGDPLVLLAQAGITIQN